MPASQYDFWQIMDELEFDSFQQTKNQLHQAIQNVSAVGRTFLPESKIDENAVLEWIPFSKRLAGKWIQGEIKFRSSISLESFVVYLVDSSYTELSSLKLVGKKQGAIMVWLEEQLALLGVQSANISLNYPYLIPEYPQSKGKTFDPSLPDAAALANLYHNSWLGITQFIALIDGFARLTVWPHHFDMATLQVVKDTGDPETSASIGVGMSPGDHHIDEPYFYMNSWPYAQQDDFPELKYGEWYEEDWAGAILKYSELVKEISPAIQREILQTFLESTYQVLRATII